MIEIPVQLDRIIETTEKIAVTTDKIADRVVKNIMGYSIIALCVAVCVLFYIQLNLNSYIRNTMQKNTAKMETLIEKNVKILQDIQFVFITNKETERINARRRGEAAAEQYIQLLEAENEVKK